MKQKIKTLNEKVAKLSNEEAEDMDSDKAPEAEKDFDELNRDFYLIGGIHGFIIDCNNIFFFFFLRSVGFAI